MSKIIKPEVSVTATPVKVGNVYGLTPANNSGISLGYQALDSITVSSENSIAIGLNAISTAESSSGNVAIGSNAMSVNTLVGYNNVAIGGASLRDNYSGGNSNTAVGHFSLPALTTGYENVAIGASSSYSLFNGIQNTAVGYSSFGGKNGSRNTAIGHTSQQGSDGQSVTDNTSVGYASLALVQAGNYNTAIGSESLKVLTSAANNTAVGFGSGRTITTGSNNTAIGFLAGGNGTVNLTTGANNVMIGYNAVPASSTSSNSVTFGNPLTSSLRCQVTSISGLSDERDKKDIVDLPVGLDFINGLRPVNFVWNMRPDLDEEGNVIATGKVDVPDMGFIAQDFVAAEDATGLAEHLQLTLRDNPEKLEATYGRLVPILVKAIQELTARVEELEAAN